MNATWYNLNNFSKTMRLKERKWLQSGDEWHWLDKLNHELPNVFEVAGHEL
jgi:hypothetical protein